MGIYGFDVYGNFFSRIFFSNVQEEELFFIFAVPDASFDFVGYKTILHTMAS